MKRQTLAVYLCILYPFNYNYDLLNAEAITWKRSLIPYLFIKMFNDTSNIYVIVYINLFF